jgi:hypothetical protein
MSKEKQIDLVDNFRSELMHKFIDLCRGNDYNKLTLLKIGDTVDQIFDKQIKDILVDEAGYRKQSEWISVEERLPDIDPYGKGRYGGARSVRVLCACKQRSGRTFTKEGYYEPCGNGKVFWRIPGSVDSVTHWMPLPEPPKGE